MSAKAAMVFVAELVREIRKGGAGTLEVVLAAGNNVRSVQRTAARESTIKPRLLEQRYLLVHPQFVRLTRTTVTRPRAAVRSRPRR